MTLDREIALREAGETLGSCVDVLDGLRVRAQPGGGDGSWSMTPRHAKELLQYLEAHKKKLEARKAAVEGLRAPKESAPANPDLHVLASQRFDFDSAIRFVREAFIKPRCDAESMRVLEAADWYCTEAFQRFLERTKTPTTKFPVGPIVAIDSTRTPAIWKENAQLRIPSIFAEAIAVRGANRDTLPPFPVICLPADLIALPEYFVLLSHEVGHAVDDALLLREGVLAKLTEAPLSSFWKAWMREIIADAAAVEVAGKAFAVALWRYAARRPLDRELTESNPYPPMELRLLFLKAMMGATLYDACGGLPSVDAMENLPKIAESLLSEFSKKVVPVLQEYLFHDRDIFGEENAKEGAALTQLEVNRIPAVSTLPFLRVPSVFTLAILGNGKEGHRIDFKKWHKKYRNSNAKPRWIDERSSWDFSEDTLPTLRPTIFGPDGITKYPPIVLLAAHDRISFVGGTNKWLACNLAKALARRKKENSPWEQIDVFFASDTLLLQLERYDKGSTVKWPLARLIEERDEQIEILKKQFLKQRKWIKSAVFRISYGTALFASYWDSNERGGRIHVSTQLLGMDVGVCPSADHIWLRAEPTKAYRDYQAHLRGLEQSSREVFRLQSESSIPSHP